MSHHERQLRCVEADLMDARMTLRKLNLPDLFQLEAGLIADQLADLETRVKRLRRCGF